MANPWIYPYPGDNRARILAAARAAGKGTLNLSDGVFLLLDTLSLKGLSCAIRGQGDGTVLRHLPGQAGPVIDFTGYLCPPNMLGVRSISDFSVEGDGLPGRSKSGIRIRLLGGLELARITIQQTGGPGLDLDFVQHTVFRQIVLGTPVGAKSGDVPYLRAVGPTNANTFQDLLLRSVVKADDTGVSGAIIFTDDGTNSPNQNFFTGIKIEYLHIPSGGCLFSMAGSLNDIQSFALHDIGREAEATGTCVYRFLNPSAENYGGNILHGIIPGNEHSSVGVDCGVEVHQSGNAITGVKRYYDNHVWIGPGVQRTTVDLMGSEATAIGRGWVDESGEADNSLVDRVTGVGMVKPLHDGNDLTGGG